MMARIAHAFLLVVILATAALTSGAAMAETLRIATYNTELTRDGPGLLLRDLQKGKDKQIQAVVQIIVTANPDILALQGIDWDHGNHALTALRQRLAEAGADYPFALSLKPNRGLATDLDLNGDGRTHGPEDSQGFGVFTGQNGIALLSKHPINHAGVQDFTDLLWANLPGALLPETETGPFPSAEALAIQRLSSTGHWAVPIHLPSGKTLTVMTYQAGPPVFDGPEDRNGKRNHDETRLWSLFLDGAFGQTPKAHFVIAGVANLDPQDGDGRPEALNALRTDPRLQDPAPTSTGAANAPDQGHLGPNATDTVDWDGPGRLRVDYVLPSADLAVTASGVIWPETGPLADAALIASRHRLVWVDIVAP